MKGVKRLFDQYVFVDWSASSQTRPTPGKDTTWVAHGCNETEEVEVVNTCTRLAAVEKVRGLLVDAVARCRRVLVGFDFAYGYPAGLAADLGLQGTFPWRSVWGLLNDLANDANVGREDTDNTLDRFAIANELNRRFAARHVGHPSGPWWGRPDWTLFNSTLQQLPDEIRMTKPFTKGTRKGGGASRRNICAERGICPADNPMLEMTSPGFPFKELTRFRRTETATGGAQESWKIFGNGSVGSQALSGIPYLERLLTDDRLAKWSRVWPFTTGFEDPTANSDGPLVVHAEVFPSCIPVDLGLHQVRDACQVHSLVQLASECDINGNLLSSFLMPTSLRHNEQAAREVIAEEGWILFVGD